MSAATLSDTAYEKMRDDITSGRIPGETVLSERALTETLGVSRTPLRVALSRLEKEGMVDRLSNGAVLVRSVSVEQLLQILHLRRQLETAAARRAARNGPTASLKALRDRMQALAEGAEVSFDVFWQDDGAFHRAVAEAAGLTILPAILDEQRGIARRSALTRANDSFVVQAAEHVAIADVIAAQDEEAAATLMADHFENVRARFLGSFTGT